MTAPTGLLPTVSASASAPTPTQLAVNALVAFGAQCVSHAQMLYGQGFRLVWNNPQGLTPQQVCNALGNQAGALFTSAAALAAWANAIQSNAITQAPPKAFTINGDGTVTISA